MAHFIQTTSGIFINADDISRVMSADGDSKNSVIRIRGSEDRFTVWEKPGDLVQRISAEYLSAQPGYAVVSQNVDCTLDEFKEWQTPVVAWRFSTEEDWPTPITAEGPWDQGTSDSCLLVCPNGQVVHLGNRSWASLEEAYASLKGEVDPPA